MFISEKLFENYDNCTLYVPIGTIEAYRSQYPWSRFSNIVEFDVTGIDHATVSPNDEAGARQVFDMHGRRIQQPQKGLNIINGKKVLVR